MFSSGILKRHMATGENQQQYSSKGKSFPSKSGQETPAFLMSAPVPCLDSRSKLFGKEWMKCVSAVSLVIFTS